MSTFSHTLCLQSAGKRAWKENPGDEENRRTQSNTIYRDHRLTEIASEAQIVLEICQKSGTMKDISARDLTRRLATRLVYLSGGGTTPEHGTGDRAGQIHSSSKTIQRAFMNSLFFSFGVSTTVSKLNIPISKDSLKTLSQKEANRILGSVGLQGGIVKNDGTLDIHRIFSAGIGNAKTQKKRKKKTQKIEVELGAGFGDWIVQKAVEDPATNYMAVELRADRVAQIYARTAILSYDTPVNNLCVVGGDSGNFLLNFLTPESVDTVYVNHPEPPTQTFGAESDALKAITQGGDEPAHMLHSNILIAAAKALKKRSKLVIVTDNKWYGMLICATLSKVKKANPKLLDNHDLHHEDQSFHQIDSHKSDGLGETEHFVPLFEGQPNKTIGYPSQKSGRGDSYFDRLWRAGGGTHAEKRSRFVIIQKRGNLDGI
jgi:tRNA G46 methylase TrmB